jgi:hypothetical protein
MVTYLSTIIALRAQLNRWSLAEKMVLLDQPKWGGSERNALQHRRNSESQRPYPLRLHGQVHEGAGESMHFFPRTSHIKTQTPCGIMGMGRLLISLNV